MGLFDILNNKEFGDKLKEMTEKVRAGAQDLGQELGKQVPVEWQDKLRELGAQARETAQELGVQAKETARDLGQKAQEYSRKSPGTAGLVGAGILGVILGAVMPRGVAKTAGLAGLGAVAWNFYQKWSANNAAAQNPQASISMDDPAARLLVKAMIFAAKADGQIDSAEGARIAAMLKQMYPGQDTTPMLNELTAGDADPAALATDIASPEQGEDIYRLSCLVVEADNDAEREYLAGLARVLNIADDRKLVLEGEANEARAKLA